MIRIILTVLFDMVLLIAYMVFLMWLTDQIVILSRKIKHEVKQWIKK